MVIIDASFIGTLPYALMRGVGSARCVFPIDPMVHEKYLQHLRSLRQGS